MAATPYEVNYADEAARDIKELRAYDQSKIMEAIETQLVPAPTKVSRSGIKKMTQPFWSQFRLRVEDFRVYYDVDEPKRQVSVLRILEKGRKATAKEPDK